MSEAIAVRVAFDKDIAALFQNAGLRSVYAVGKALDEVGNKTKTQVIRATAKQAGVKYGKAKGVIASPQAMGAGNGQFEIVARDVNSLAKEILATQDVDGRLGCAMGKAMGFSSYLCRTQWPYLRA